ncbi:MAG: sulfatase-like hydrolase/transferase [Hydrogenophaga sp.]|uniref:sulfatase-like hydrolase/transferase n=1 Tax=Hydrogenophaga sp. TaxID=1904254 RepID=UPI0027216618|nr:sulfatase-like hydrolase/transferase [Hydrogenophaga sp.]MDO9132092.1 sulfatase-like hydrolase/transferase [Hydrogenophaga sp.]MDO9503849.1 sulfatase-like hydrolase/transferase [Hydrogenophaga sp.]MDP3203166.1 sulfatase-like hydrolase/transferase [Hydrogenophaga sp.]MDP3627018.1 sulfatase-like hydrolase/transferase [Hydrogenophaga sp.]
MWAQAQAAPPSASGWLLRFLLAFGVLNTLLTFENRWPGFGVAYMPRLSFELCLALVALLGWVAWRGGLSSRAAWVGTAAFVGLVLVRYANVTAPAVMGRPVNVYWDGRHAGELLRVAAQAMPGWQVAAAIVTLLAGGLLLALVVRWSIGVLASCLVWSRPRPWLLSGVGACALSFAAYVPDQSDTRWFFSLPITPTLLQQGQLLAQVWLPGHSRVALGPSPAFGGDLSGLVGTSGPADVLLVFAESYGAITFDDATQAAALAEPRAELAQAIQDSGRFVVSARVTAPTFGGSSWLSHAALLAGVDTTDPADHDLLLTSQRPTLVSHFARHGYRTVGWMPGLKSPWPEGAFYGFDRLADDAGIGYRGRDFGYWRIPDQAAMAMLQAQELDRTSAREPRFAVFATTSTHAPFHPIAPFVADSASLTSPEAYAGVVAAPAAGSFMQPLPLYVEGMRYQHAWMADYLRRQASRPMVMIVVGDHQPPALVSGRGASWEVPVHVVSDDAALLQRLLGNGFVAGLTPPPASLGRMPTLTSVLLNAFDAPGAHETRGIDHVVRPADPALSKDRSPSGS